jgi:hypothetical protein
MVAGKKEDVAVDLRGIVYREGGLWIAHCLELDIVAEGPTPQAALDANLELCVFQIETALENDDLESVFRAAPAKYWTLFYSRVPKKRLPSSQRLPVKRFEARELVGAE